MITNPERWIDRYGDILYRFALMRVKDSELAEELVQETLFSALKARKGFAGKSSEKTWLIGILKHKIVDYYRSNSSKTSGPDPLELSLNPDDDFFDQEGRWRKLPEKWERSPEKILENKEFWEVLHGCVDGLSPNLRQAFTLRELDEMGSEEICKFIGISSTNLWVVLHRARIALRRCLEINWFGGRR